MLIILQLIVYLSLLQAPAFPLNNSFSEAFSVFHNPGRLATLRQASVGVYSERRFMLQELGIHSLAAGIPVAGGVVGLKLIRTGYRLYREMLAGVGYAMPLGKKLRAAAMFNYNMNRPGGELGLDWQVSPQCRMGVHLFQPGTHNAVNSISLGYKAAEQLLLDIVCRKETRQDPALQIQCTYLPLKRFYLMAGYISNPVYQYAGAGYGVGQMVLGMTGSFHQALGITPGITVVWGRN